MSLRNHVAQIGIMVRQHANTRQMLDYLRILEDELAMTRQFLAGDGVKNPNALPVPWSCPRCTGTEWKEWMQLKGEKIYQCAACKWPEY